MVTDSASISVQQSTSLLVRAANHLRQFICRLHGHDALLHFEQGRMSLQCTSCGYETPGWDVKAPARSEVAGTPRRGMRLPLVSQRRAA